MEAKVAYSYALKKQSGYDAESRIAYCGSRLHIYSASLMRNYKLPLPPFKF